MVGDGVQRRLGHGVDHAGRDQLNDVPGVVIGRILDPGGRPQRSLRPRVVGLERLPPVGGEHPLVALVGQPGVGDRGRAAQRLRSGVPILSSRASISASTRLTKNDATDSMRDRSRPACRARSSPSR
jgi:hypothetical protein